MANRFNIPAAGKSGLGLIFISNTCMKKLLLLLLALPTFSFAQDSCQLKKETDPFTHEAKISTGFVSFVSGGVKFNVSIDATPSQIDFFFWFTGDSKCFDDESTVQLIYEGERLKANFKKLRVHELRGRVPLQLPQYSGYAF